MRYLEESDFAEKSVMIIDQCDSLELQLSYLKLLKSLLQKSSKIRNHFNLINGYDFLQAIFINLPYLLNSMEIHDYVQFFTIEVQTLVKKPET